MNTIMLVEKHIKFMWKNDDKPSDFRGAPFLDNRKPCFPKVWGGSCNYTFFFSCRSSPKIKNAKSGKKSFQHGCCKVGVQENKCWSQESRISNIRLYHRILYVSKICLPGLHGFPNKVGVQEKNLWANLSNRRG